MNKLEQTILVGLANVIDARNAAEVPAEFGMVSAEYRELVAAKALAAEQTAEIDLAAFIGRQPTSSERVMASRAYKSLERRGYVVRVLHCWSDRTAQLELTPAGRAAIAEFSTEATKG